MQRSDDGGFTYGVTGGDILIGGLIVRDNSSKNQSQDILLRGIGPSLALSQPLSDPQLALIDIHRETRLPEQ